MRKLLWALTATLLLGMSASYAACDKPVAPTIPDGAAATEADMLAGQTAVQDYMALANTYLACLTTLDAESADQTVDAKEARVNTYNQMVDEMQHIADQFNAALRNWKSRSSS